MLYSELFRPSLWLDQYIRCSFLYTFIIDVYNINVIRMCIIRCGFCTLVHSLYMHKYLANYMYMYIQYSSRVYVYVYMCSTLKYCQGQWRSKIVGFSLKLLVCRDPALPWRAIHVCTVGVIEKFPFCFYSVFFVFYYYCVLPITVLLPCASRWPMSILSLYREQSRWSGFENSLHRDPATTFRGPRYHHSFST